MPNNMFNGGSPFSDDHIYFRRAHIHNLLRKSVQKPVVTVVAGAGYGKTQAVYMFLKEYEAVTTWVQLTMLDNLSVRFWENLVSGLSQSNKELASSLEMLGFPETAVKFDIFLSYILKYVDPAKKHVFVYDDFHMLHDKKMLRFIEKYIHSGITTVSAILISRSVPEINMTGLIEKGMVSAINEDDLCFSKSDMVDYYEMQGIHIPRQLVPKIYDNTAGWIMAIRLIELSIKKGVAHKEYAIIAMKLNIYKLMESDVYLHLPEKVKIFLAELSLFDSLPAKFVEELASNNNHLISAISQINSFIRFDSFSNMYCIHHLFLEFLRQRQDILTQSMKTECYQKAADWYASNGYIIDAITYYGKAGDYDGILKVALFWSHASAEEGALVLDIMSRAPKEVCKRTPMIAMLCARALWLVGKPHESMREMDAVIKKYETLPKTQENFLILSELYMTTGLSYYYYTNYSRSANDFRFADYIMRAYDYIKDSDVSMEANYTFQDVGTYVCRINSEKKEDMEKYVEAVKTMAYYAPKMMPGCMCGMDDLTLTELFYFRNSFKAAEKSAYQAMHKASEHGQQAVLFRAIFYLIRIGLAEGNYSKIHDCINRLDLQLETENSPFYKALYDTVVSWFYALIGQGDKAAGWVKSNYEHVDLYSVSSGSENIAKIKYHLCEKKYDELLAFLELQESVSDIKSFLVGRIVVEATKAVCLYHTEQKDMAISALREAYLLAEPNAMTMQFVELGNNMVALAKFALKSEGCAIPENWLKNILRKSSTYAKRLSRVAAEYKRVNNSEAEAQVNLTKRELELLNDIFHGLSKTEIASNYGLSPNYVKNRLQSIYAKLGAENRNDAIRIAVSKKFIK